MIDPDLCKDVSFLVVDDQIHMNELVDMVVSSLGARSVVRVDGGLKALEAIATKVPDILITDLNMDDLDGLALARAVRAMPEPARSIHIIMVTGRHGDDIEQTAMAAGIDVFITKPIWTKRLFTALEDYVKGR